MAFRSRRRVPTSRTYRMLRWRSVWPSLIRPVLQALTHPAIPVVSYGPPLEGEGGRPSQFRSEFPLSIWGADGGLLDDACTSRGCSTRSPGGRGTAIAGLSPLMQVPNCYSSFVAMSESYTILERKRHAWYHGLQATGCCDCWFGLSLGKHNQKEKNRFNFGDITTFPILQQAAIIRRFILRRPG